MLAVRMEARRRGGQVMVSSESVSRRDSACALCPLRLGRCVLEPRLSTHTSSILHSSLC